MHESMRVGAMKREMLIPSVASWNSRAAISVRSLPLKGGGSGWGSRVDARESSCIEQIDPHPVRIERTCVRVADARPRCEPTSPFQEEVERVARAPLTTRFKRD